MTGLHSFLRCHRFVGFFGLAVIGSVPHIAMASGPAVIDIQPCPSCRIVNGTPLDQITLTFSEPVHFGGTDFELRSRRNLGGVVAFSLAQASPSQTVTLVLDAPLVDDAVTVVINYSIHSAATGEAMDGEWPVTAPRLPTGNAVSGGQCVVQYKVLQGDVNGDGFVNVADQILVGLHHGENIAQCSCSINPEVNVYDVDGDGVVEADTPGGNDQDLVIVTEAISRSMPLTDGIKPAVDLITPENGTILCDQTVGTVSVLLTQALDLDTITTSTLFATDRAGNVHTCSSVIPIGDGSSLDFLFAPPLDLNEVYDFTLSESLADGDGDLLARNTFEVICAFDPVITEQPVGQQTCEGESALFLVEADSAAPLSYQWRKNGSILNGQTSDTLEFESTSPTDTDVYDVLVTNACGELASQSAALTVNALATFDVQPPTTSEVCEDGFTSLSAVVSGSGPFQYQWRQNENDLPGENGAEIVFEAAQFSDTGTYDVEVTDANNCTSLSSSTAFSVNLPPGISAQPVGLTECEGLSASISVTASGSGTLSYQWRQNGADQPGSTSSTLDFGNLELGDSGLYDVEITDANGCITLSETANVFVNDTPVITEQPESVNALEADLVTFVVEATDSTALAYQWRKDGDDIAGATLNTYSISAAELDDAGSYDVVITDATGCETVSDPADLTVDTSEEEIAPTITTPPGSQTVCEGVDVTYSVEAEGTAPLTYQWRLDGDDIVGADEDSYTLDLVSVADSGGSFDVVVTNDFGSVTSSDATLNVQAEPVITNQPDSQTVVEGESVTLTIAATGAGLTYQWRKNGSELPNGTGTQFILADAQLSDAGTYDVVITASCGDVTSDDAVLTVSIAVTNTNDNVPDNGNANANDNTSTPPGGGGSDDDDDGVDPEFDLCPNTPDGIPVDENGCPLDDGDQDGVLDPEDDCPDTAEGILVDDNGCPAIIVTTIDNSATEPPAEGELPGTDFDNASDDSSRRNSAAACGACGGIGLINFAVLFAGLLVVRNRFCRA